MVGADPNALDEDGNAPLHLAALARPCPASLAKALVEHGAHLVGFVLLCNIEQYFNDCFRILGHKESPGRNLRVASSGSACARAGQPGPLHAPLMLSRSRS